MVKVSAKDVDQHELVKRVAGVLKKTGKLDVPEWVDLVKLAKFNELPPVDPDWFYTRAASIARHLYMRSPAGKVDGMNCEEVEFIAGNTRVDIIPTFNETEMHLISGDVGPFEAGIPLSVPLWLAVFMKERHKCRVIPPDWLSVASLEQMVANEVENASKFSDVPTHFMEISRLLFAKASEDIANGDKVKTLLKDLWDSRQAKLRTSVDTFVKSAATLGKVDNLTQLEITVVRPPLVGTLDHLRGLQSAMQTVTQNLPTGF